MKKILASLGIMLVLNAPVWADSTTGNLTSGGTIQTQDLIPVVRPSVPGTNLKVSVGSAATQSIGTSGAFVPLLNAANTWSALQNFLSGDLTAVSPVFTGTTKTGVVQSSLNATTLPAAQTGTVLQIANADGVATRLEVDAFGSTGYFSAMAYGGTNASPTALTSGTEIGGFNAWGYNGTALVGPRASFRAYATENWTTSHNGTRASIAATPIGSTAQAEVASFQGGGGITVPSTVTGGDKGVGTVNAAGIYQGGVSLGSLAFLNSTPAPTTSTLGGILSLASATSHQFVQYVDSSGVQHIAQPAMSDITGVATIAQGGTGQSTTSAALDALDGLAGSTPTNTITGYRYYSTQTAAVSYGGENKYLYKADPQYMPRLHACAAKIRAGTGRCFWIDDGNSTTIGVNASGVANWPNESSYLAAMLTKAGWHAYNNSFAGDGAGSGIRHAVDNRLQINSFLTTGLNTLGGIILDATGAGASATWTPKTPIDTCIPFYSPSGNNTANGTIQVGSGSTTALNGVGQGVIYSATATGTLGVNSCAINYGSSTGTLYWEAMRAYDSTQPGFDIMNAGWWGATLANLTDTSATYSSLNILVAMNPDVVKLKITINDTNTGVSLSTFTSQLTTFATTLHAAGIDVVFETDNPINNGNQSKYVDALYQVAATYNVPVINSYAAWTSYSFANTILNFMADGFHPLSVGYADQARYVADFVTQIIGTMGTDSVSAAAPNVVTIADKEIARFTTAGNFGVGTSTPAVGVDFGSMIDALALPSGTTAQRPSSPAVGQIRYNKSLNNFEGYSGSSPAWAALGGSTAGPDVQKFTTSGTWTKPTAFTPKIVRVIACGPGGGAGSGGMQSLGTATSGGGSGGAGGCRDVIFNAADLTSTVAVTVPTGGAGGAQTTSIGSGNNGAQASSNTTFGSYLTAFKGGFGSGGSTSGSGGGSSAGYNAAGNNASGATGGSSAGLSGGAAGGGTGSSGSAGVDVYTFLTGGSGSGGSTSAGVAGSVGHSSGSGGTGGGLTTTTASAGGAGGGSLFQLSNPAGGAATGANGTANDVSANSMFGSDAPGGGGANAAGAGGAGGAVTSGTYACGGAGGGAGTTAGGAGGNGCPGIVTVISE